MGIVAVWTQPIASSIDFLRTAFRAATETGDLAVACYCMDKSVTGLLMRNDPLEAVWRESEIALNFVRNARYHDVDAVIVSQQRFIATMQGRTSTFSTFSDAEFDEAAFEAQIDGGSGRPPRSAFTGSSNCRPGSCRATTPRRLRQPARRRRCFGPYPSISSGCDYFYYAALTVAALYDNASAADKQAWRDLLAAHQQQLREWADNLSPTFARQARAGVGRDRAHRRARPRRHAPLRAGHPIRPRRMVSCRTRPSPTSSPRISTRRAASRRFADAYLRNARYCYLRWGAEGKVQQLDRLHPHLRETPIEASPTTTIGASLEQLDAGAVIKASQAVSGEIVLDRLIETLMTIALEHAGAQRGLLILLHGDAPRIEAEAKADQKTVVVTLRQEAVTPAEMPESLLHTVMRMRQSVILDDASAKDPFRRMITSARSAPGQSSACLS